MLVQVNNIWMLKCCYNFAFYTGKKSRDQIEGILLAKQKYVSNLLLANQIC